MSDRAHSGTYTDASGPAIETVLREYLASPWSPCYRLVPDEQPQIEAALRSLADQEQCALIITTGGTGPAPRDVTPEATEAVCDRMLPGFGEQMRTASLKYVPTAILSRQTAGIYGQTLIINLPGNPKSIKECLDAVFPAVPYCVDLLGGPRFDCHSSRMNCFRPKQTPQGDTL